MSNSLFGDLSWLPRPPADFNALCRRIDPKSACGEDIRSLSAHFLDENQLNRLSKIIGLAIGSNSALKPLSAFRLGVLSNSTVEFIVPCVVATAARHGIALDCVTGAYDQVMQDALSPQSLINSAKPDAVLLAIDYRGLPLQSLLSDKHGAESAAAIALDYLDSVRNAIRTNCGAVCVLQTIAPPPERLFGSLDRVLTRTLYSAIGFFNHGIAERVAASTDVLLDVASLAEIIGLEHWHSPTEWNLAKIPFANAFLPLYSDHVARLLAALRGKSRRVLVLDLDNTVWGGVIGDDGLEGIQCSQGDPTGEAHLSVQRLALELRDRGIAIAVSSKNNDDTARLPFRNHPEMLLREEHIAVFQANWNDKATNIQAIAKELSLGIDSIVFLDDNPVERNLVRRLLPEVAVPELPTDASLYARTLAAAGYFEAIAFSDEDTKRADFYQDNAKRVELQKQANNIDDYLKSLNMEITFQPFDATGRARITQLINKSNQFNLTTRRYTEAEVASMEGDPNCFTLQVRLADAFGDNGMISVVICRTNPSKTWEIDTWLMSCRVLGRRVEQMVLKEITIHAREYGIEKLVGIYRPTDRNRLVENHYSNLGFHLVQQSADGTSIWELDVSTTQIGDAPMLVRSVGWQ